MIVKCTIIKYRLLLSHTHTNMYTTVSLTHKHMHTNTHMHTVYTKIKVNNSTNSLFPTINHSWYYVHYCDTARFDFAKLEGHLYILTSLIFNERVALYHHLKQLPLPCELSYIYVLTVPTI